MGLFGNKEKESKEFIPRELKCPYCEGIIKETNEYKDESNVNVMYIDNDYPVLAIGCPHCKKIIGTIVI